MWSRRSGIPFARAERLRPGRPVEAWPRALDATEFGPASLQPPGEVFLAVDMPQSEDCLSLNVWAPERAPGSASDRPVMVWIHGGGFRQGSGAHMLSRGQVLAARGDVVVVTVNYRLGALGFLTHPDLADDEGVCGNWGVLDLVTALQWVRDEIGAFGGDADQRHAVRRIGRRHARRRCSPPRPPPGVVPPRDRAERRADRDVASSARAVWPKSSPRRSASGPCASCATRGRRDPRRPGRAGGASRRPHGVHAVASTANVIERAPVDALGSGAAAGIPMMIGTNVDEMRLLAAGDPHRTDLDDDGLRRRLDKVLDGGVDDVIETVRRAREARGEPATPSDLWFAIDSDRFFRVPSLRAADAHVAHEPRTFVYLFGWPSPALDGWVGACHVLEIPFVFGLHDAPDLARASPAPDPPPTVSASR